MSNQSSVLTALRNVLAMLENAGPEATSVYVRDEIARLVALEKTS